MKEMDNRNNRDNRKNRLRNRFLVQLLSFMMIFSMMPGQSLMAFALPDDSATVAEETAGQPSEDQGTDGQEDVQEPEQPAETDVDETADGQQDAAGGGNSASQGGETAAGGSDALDQKAAETAPAQDDSSEEPKPVRASAEEQAEKNYGPDGVAKTLRVALTDDKDTALAGDQISYNVDVSMWAAATYPYDGQNQEVMFEEWKNIKILMKLPEHVKITGIKQKNVGKFKLIDESTNTWEIELNNPTRDASNSNSINFDVNTLITGNGELADGTVLGKADVTVSTDFDVRINEDGTVRRYSRTVTDDTEEINLSSPDKWVMTKSPYDEPKNYTIDTDKRTVTVHYRIKYGIDVNGAPSDIDTVYTTTGRAPFDHDITLTDTPTLTLHNGKTVDALHATVTPAKAGYIYKDGRSADEGGKAKAITFESGQPVNLPYAVVGENSKEVAKNAPAYSEYNVDMVYNYEDFMVWFYENAKKTDADSHNDAEIKYQILGREKPETTGDDGDTTIPGYIEPGEIEIDKFIVSYDSDNEKLYSRDNGFNADSLISGPATFEVLNEDGTAATLYYKSILGQYDTLKDGGVETNVVTIDPAQGNSHINSNEGNISFYLKAGTYKIREKITVPNQPSNTKPLGGAEKTITVNKGGKAVAKFRNKEQLGQIKIHKTDDSNNALPVSGAVFGLYEDEQHKIPVKDESGKNVTATTNNSGNASFTRIVPGTYYLWELSVPSDYVRSDKVTEVNVTAGNTSDKAVELKNHCKKVVINLLKKYSTVSAPNDPMPVTDDYRAFENAFALQRKGISEPESAWKTIGTYSIDNKGATSVLVDEIDSDENKLQYRFVETIPEGYFDTAGNPGDGKNTVNSIAITPADGEHNITMYNRKGGRIELTKNKVSVDASTGAYDAVKEAGKRFKLYRVAEGSPAEEVAEVSTDSNGKAVYENLISADSEGNIYTYYVVEQNTDDGYTWVTDSSISIGGTNTPALKIGSFTKQSGNVLTQTTYNIQQDIVIGIIKQDKLDKSKLEGAEFIVSGGPETQRVTSTNTKVSLQIKLGYKYTIKEDSVPAGYYRDASDQTIDTTGWKVGRKSDGSYAVFKADGTEVTSDDLTFTFEDTPYKKILLIKRLRDDDQIDDDATASLPDIVFSVYVKKDGKFEKYEVGGQAVTIRGNNKDTIKLPEGTYYLHEDTRNEKVLYPDQHKDKYSGKGEYDETGKKFYFGPYVVTRPTNEGDSKWVLDIVNISNVGDLVAHKVLYDKDNKPVTNKAGFTMEVFRAGSDGKPTGSALQTKVTGEEGNVAFIDLPVYDDNGQKIKYAVKERYTGNQANNYYTDNFVSDASPQEIKLVGDTDAGYVYNHQYLDVQVVKKYYDAREYELTGLKYVLEGATIALYKNNGDGTYTYIDSAETDSRGQVSFGTLRYAKDGYVAIEVSVPDKPEYKRMVPVDGDYLPTDSQGRCPESLTEAQVKDLSKAVLTSANNYKGEIDNTIPWTQIHITKWNEYKTEKLNGANFTLYKQVLPEDTHGGELTFDKAKCTVVGEYTSGTWIHEDQAQKGIFQTDVLENADNIVYWLVETKAPSGYSPIDAQNYVLFTRAGTTYTNKSNDGKSTLVYPGGLVDNQINKHDVTDHKEQGDGDGTENWAYIEFNKWMQKESTAGTKKEDLKRSDFTLMPNATFELYAVNASDNNKVLLLDTITTGDENDMEEGSLTTGYGVSRSMDAWTIFDELEDKCPDQLNNIITYQSSDDSGYDVTYPYVVGPDGKPVTDAEGNRKRIKGTFTLNAVLIEKSSSSKYALDLHDHAMQIVFVPSDLELGNAKYAVPDLEQSGAALCDPEHADDVRMQYEENEPGAMAIVDYLTTDNSVVLRHFGYDPEQAGYELYHDDLEDLYRSNPSLFVSKEVTFALEKRKAPNSNVWEAWSPTENKKSASGKNTFKTDGNGFHFDNGLDPGEYRVVMTSPAAGYENFYQNADTAFRFTVVTTDRTQVFTAYSPEKPDVTIEKVNLNGDTVSEEASFSLTSKEGTSYSQTAQTTDGKAVFKDLPANTTFILSETKAPAGYTSEYFVQLFKEQYPDYAPLVETGGYPLSYVTKDDKGERIIVKKEYKKAFSLKIPNAKTVNVKLTKKDSQNTAKLLDKAEFTIYYHAFGEFSDNYTVPEYPSDDTAWVNIGTATTGPDGTVTKENLKPGVYYVVETKAPPHYDISPEAKEGKIVVMTGGLDLKISHPEKYTVNTNEGGTGELEFRDPPKVKMTVKKKIELGSLDPRDYSFTFTLKDSEGKTIAGNPGKASRTGEKETSALFEDLSQGETYYLNETVPGGYKLDKVMVGSTVVNAETTGKFNGYYKIKIPTDGSDVTVSVTNILLEAQVTIFKYDGETGTGLPGALFEVLKSDEETVVQKAEFTDNGDGTYKVVIPLESTTPAIYYIHETRAPEFNGKKYTIDEENSKIKVEVKPGDKLKYTFNGPRAHDNKYALPNFEGIDVTILKYDGVFGQPGIKELEGAQFQMYFSTDGGNKWNTWHPFETTGSDGKANFQIVKGYKYAIAEINDVKGFIGLEGVYKNDTKLETDTSTDGRTLYVLGDDFENDKTYEFKAYNIPFLKLIVEKEDISTTVNKPNVEFHVYEVPDGTPKTLTEKQISDLADAATVFIDDVTENSTYTNEQFLRPGRTYLAVEDRAIDSESQEDDYSIILDDSRVVSYKVFSVPEKNYEKEYKVTFKNNKGNASIGLTKSVDKEEIASLTIKEAELTYTLKPESTNSYALDAYKLNDSGLTPTPGKATLADEWYNITEVIVGQGSMDNYLKGADEGKDYQIYATVTFVGFDGKKYTQDPVNVSEGNITVVPPDTSGKNIKSFYVEYSSPDLVKDTGYALGQKFKAGETVVKATVFKQEKPETGVITALTKITNNADVSLTYTPWSSTGRKQQQTTLTADNHVETVVNSTKAPKVKFEKDGPDPDEAVELGSDLTYKLKVTNISGEPLDFSDPIIVDLLPQGMIVDQDSEFVRVVSKPTTITNDPVVKTGYAGVSQYVNIEFSGVVKDGESIEVELTAKVTTAVTNYGNYLRNFAFTTSKEVGVATSDNTTGAVIKDDDGLWAGELVELAKTLKCEEDRAQALKTALGIQGTYGYLGDWHENYWVVENQLVCIKDEYGPADGGIYRTDKVSVLVNDEHDADQRTMHYRLTINNLSASKRTNLAVMDIMPVIGDNRINNTPRGSNWQLYFKKMGSVKVNDQSCSAYTVYYYSGDASAFDADDITRIITEAQNGCPSGWTDSDSGKSTAIIVAFNYDKTDATEETDDKTVVLEGTKSVQIEYTAETPYREAEPLAEIVFTNAANDFNFGFKTFAPPSTADKARENDPLGSNVVEVTIAPPKVKVGGDVWIDADDNGVQDDGDQSWYLEFDIVKQLIKDLNVSLNTSNLRNLSTTETTDGTIKETGSDKNNYGIAHFEFDELTSAKLRNGSTDYVNWNDGTASKLIGKNPYTYNMRMNYAGSTFTKTQTTIDPRGSWVPGKIPEPDQKDDNFNTNDGAYNTEQFFLHSTKHPNWDMTKDIGFDLYRNLELTKYSQKTGEPVEGAEFKIYGPYEHDTGADQELTDSDVVATLTTDKDGKIKQDDLFFFKEYVIVETKAAKGFSIEGAEAAGANIKKLDEGKWLLTVPDKKSKTLEEKVTVHDPENIDVSVEKIWADDNDAFESRPESIKVMLYTDEKCTEEAKDADGKVVDAKTLNAGNEWKTSWTDLPRYKVVKNLLGKETKTEIKYYVKETDSEGNELKGYNVEIVSDTDESSGSQSLTITNTPISTGLDVRKTWEDTEDAAAKVTAVTFRVESSTDGETWTTVKKQGEDVTLTIERKNGEKMGTAGIDGLPAVDADNNPLTYRAVEISITADGKTLEVKDGKVGCYEVTEKHTPGSDPSPENATARDLSEISNIMIPTEFSVEKTFVDDEFSQSRDITSIKVMLQRKTGEGDWADVKDFDLKPWNGWKHTWKDLPKLDPEGNAYEYRAIEVSYTTKKGETVIATYDSSDKTSGTAGAYRYTSRTEGSEEDGFTTYIENKPLIGSLRVSKKWKDTKRSKAPESLTITLRAFADGKEIRLKGVVRSVTLSSSNNWADNTTWAALPVYTVDGVRITYTLTESGKGKYKAEYKINYGDGTTKAGTGETLDVNIYVDRVVDATFTNTLEPPVKTGDVSPLAAYLTLLILSAAGILAFFIRRKRSI